MRASLAMYDRPETAPALDQLWAHIRDGMRAAGIAAPDALDRQTDLWTQWRAPDLVLGQTCGLPFRHSLHRETTLIGTLDYGLPNCAKGHYYSVFLARANDPRDHISDFDGASLAYNEPLSQSGWAAAFDQRRAAGITLRPALRTGAHAASAQAVLDARADIAAIDAITWRDLQRYVPDMAGLKPVGHSAPTPGLPLIAAKNSASAHVAPQLRAIIASAIRALPATARNTLGLRGIVWVPEPLYLGIATPPAP